MKNGGEKRIRKISKISRKGRGKEKNQDKEFVRKGELNDPKLYILGVCDGHGEIGEKVSSYISEELPQNIIENISSLLDINTCLSSLPLPSFSAQIFSAFRKTQKKIEYTWKEEKEGAGINMSGSTCTCCLLMEKRIICCNVGDSRIVLGKSTKNEEEWEAKQLTTDHTPSVPSEKKRIISRGGLVHALKDEKGNDDGPERIWCSCGRIPGLAMTRSFGDRVGHSIGVISIPEINEYIIDEEDKVLIIASDGLWEFISNQEVVNFIKPYYVKNDIKGALEFLCGESQRRWMEQEGTVDDITIIIVFL